MHRHYKFGICLLVAYCFYIQFFKLKVQENEIAVLSLDGFDIKKLLKDKKFPRDTLLCVAEKQLGWCGASSQFRDEFIDYYGATRVAPFNFPLQCASSKTSDPLQLNYLRSLADCFRVRPTSAETSALHLYNSLKSEKRHIDICTTNFQYFQHGSRIAEIKDSSREPLPIHILLPPGLNDTSFSASYNKFETSLSLLCTVNSVIHHHKDNKYQHIYIHVSDSKWFLQRYPYSMVPNVHVVSIKTKYFATAANSAFGEWYKRIFSDKLDIANEAVHLAYKALVLWKFGGIVIDRDHLVLGAFSNRIPSRALFTSNAGSVNPSMLAFPKGDKFITALMEQLNKLDFESISTQFSSSAMITNVYNDCKLNNRPYCSNLVVLNDKLIESLPTEKQSLLENVWYDECPTYRWMLESSFAMRVPWMTSTFNYSFVNEFSKVKSYSNSTLMHKILEEQCLFMGVFVNN